MATPRLWSAFTVSLLLHAAAITLLATLPAMLESDAGMKPKYRVLMLPKAKPQEDKVLWYDFRRAIPEIVPERRFGPAKVPQGKRDPSGRTLIAHSDTPRSNKQVIWQPEHHNPLPADVAAPNLAALPSPPPPVPKPAPRLFKPPAPRQPQEKSTILMDPTLPVNTLPQDLKVASQQSDVLRRILQAPKRLTKDFVAPPSPPSKGVPASAAYSADPPPPAAMLNPSGMDLQAVIIGLNPADRMAGALPEGSRSAEFARAPRAGAPSSGAVPSQRDAPRVPGLLAHGTPGAVPEASPAVTGSASIPRVVVKETVFPSLNRTMSAPLRPSSRVIPASVESQFGNRNVYTLVVPGPGLEGYSGDWVLWFAERDNPGGGMGSRISAPVPARKYSSSGSADSPADAATSGTVQLAAAIDRSGRVSAVVILRGPASDAFRRKAALELQSWVFQPALRNGDPIEVDIVVEISFQFHLSAQAGLQ